MKMPCCLLAAPPPCAISKTMFCKLVAWATCQWMPAPVPMSRAVMSRTKLRICLKKLFWFVYQFAPFPPGMYGSASIMAIPVKEGRALTTGRDKASPMNWVM